MLQASFRFHTELNHFLPHNKKHIIIIHQFENKASIKDMIEALGVPHTEVNLILVNDQAVDFSYIVQDGDFINVYPISNSINLKSALSLQPEPLLISKFVLDIHLGKLANFLRMLGFDTLYRNDYEDEKLAEISSSEERILLTRDRGLLKRSVVKHGYYVRETDPFKQLVEVIQRFNLKESISPFHRCIRCNGLLEPVEKASIIEQLPPKVSLFYDEFRRCQSCQQVFWKGAHFERMQDFIERIYLLC